jgi:hypothetical protein
MKRVDMTIEKGQQITRIAINIPGLPLSVAKRLAHRFQDIIEEDYSANRDEWSPDGHTKKPTKLKLLKYWRARRDSNPQPSDPKSDALSS